MTNGLKMQRQPTPPAPPKRVTRNRHQPSCYVEPQPLARQTRQTMMDVEAVLSTACETRQRRVSQIWNCWGEPSSFLKPSKTSPKINKIIFVTFFLSAALLDKERLRHRMGPMAFKH